MSIKMILATGVNGELGHSDGRLPFSCPEDMAYFKRKTLNHNVVMGRKTFESLGMEGGLPNRVNNIITTKPDNTRKSGCGEYELPVMRDLIGIFESMGYKDTWIIGGKSIYLQMLDMVDEIHHTIVRDADEDADVTMKMTFLLAGGWQQVSAMELSPNATVFVWKRDNSFFEDLELSLKQAVEISKKEK